MEIMAHQLIALIIFGVGISLPLLLGYFFEYWRSRKWITCWWAMIIVGMIVCIDGAFAISSAAMFIYTGCFAVVMMYNVGDRIEHIKAGGIELWMDDDGNPVYKRKTDGKKVVPNVSAIAKRVPENTPTPIGE